MKLIKAYIRRNMIDKVVQALEAGGFTDMTVIDVKAVRSEIDSKDLDYSLELAERYMNVAKLEIVAETDRVEKIKDIILNAARTGRRGDGLIYVSPVDEAVHIRTGARTETGN
ncbi:MAG TPA: P-II family nitrogen regulator [Methylomirabilota bacterium]|nr:P-II family nitrogen regulator [Methylomirabilota bacterium]